MSGLWQAVRERAAQVLLLCVHEVVEQPKVPSTGRTNTPRANHLGGGLLRWRRLSQRQSACEWRIQPAGKHLSIEIRCDHQAIPRTLRGRHLGDSPKGQQGSFLYVDHKRGEGYLRPAADVALPDCEASASRGRRGVGQTRSHFSQPSASREAFSAAGRIAACLARIEQTWTAIASGSITTAGESPVCVLSGRWGLKGML